MGAAWVGGWPRLAGKLAGGGLTVVGVSRKLVFVDVGANCLPVPGNLERASLTAVLATNPVVISACYPFKLEFSRSVLLS